MRKTVTGKSTLLKFRPCKHCASGSSPQDAHKTCLGVASFPGLPTSITVCWNYKRSKLDGGKMWGSLIPRPSPSFMPMVVVVVSLESVLHLMNCFSSWSQTLLACIHTFLSLLASLPQKVAKEDLPFSSSFPLGQFPQRTLFLIFGTRLINMLAMQLYMTRQLGNLCVGWEMQLCK